jgi:hypothetical protein
MFDFDFGFMEDYMIVGVIVAVLLIAGGYYYYSRSRKEKHVEFDVSQDESVSSKDEYVCDDNTCRKTD